MKRIFFSLLIILLLPFSGIAQQTDPSIAKSVNMSVDNCEVSYLDYVFLAGQILQRSFQDMFPVSEAEEMEAGTQLHENIIEEGEFHLIDSDSRLKKLQKIMTKLTPYRERTGINYTLHMVDDPMVNAFSIAGGHIYFTTGIMSELKNDDEIAMVLGHELSHVDKKHCIRPLQEMAAAGALAPDWGVTAVQFKKIITLPFGQFDEYEADWAGADIITKAGYDVRKGIEVFRRWAKNETPNSMDKIFRTHPFSAERVCYLEEYISQSGK